MTTTELEGVFSHVDNDGNVTELYPDVKTDKTLTVEDKPADGKTVGDKLNEVNTNLTNSIIQNVNQINANVTNQVNAINVYLGKALYIQSFDASTGVLNTVSA